MPKVTIYFVKSFQDYLKEQDVIRNPENARERLEDAIVMIYNMEPPELEDCKDILLELQKILEQRLTGD